MAHGEELARRQFGYRAVVREHLFISQSRALARAILTPRKTRKARVGKQGSEDKRGPRRRAARGTGEQQLVAAAAEFFAEEGFRAPTRQLASRLGVTQALIYRYFPSKQALINRVFADVFVGDLSDDSMKRLLDSSESIEARLTAFYQTFANRFSKQRLGLFLRAELDDQDLAAQYTRPLNQRILMPVISALRQEARLPPPARKPVIAAERELALMLHGAIVHLGMRKHIYGSSLPDALDDHISLYVTGFVPGALTTLKKLHKIPPRGLLGKAVSVAKADRAE